MHPQAAYYTDGARHRCFYTETSRRFTAWKASVIIKSNVLIGGRLETCRRFFLDAPCLFMMRKGRTEDHPFSVRGIFACLLLHSNVKKRMIFVIKENAFLYFSCRTDL